MQYTKLKNSRKYYKYKREEKNKDHYEFNTNKIII